MIEDHIRTALGEALEKYGLFEEDVEIVLEKPRERAHGDLSTALALALAKRLKRKPRELAGEFAAGIVLDKEIVESVEIAGPGFINFRIARPYQIAALLAVLETAPPEHKAFMVQLIGSTGNRAMKQHLWPFLEDADERVARAAIRALSAMGGRDVSAEPHGAAPLP